MDWTPAGPALRKGCARRPPPRTSRIEGEFLEEGGPPPLLLLYKPRYRKRREKAVVRSFRLWWGRSGPAPGNGFRRLKGPSALLQVRPYPTTNEKKKQKKQPSRTPHTPPPCTKGGTSPIKRNNTGVRTEHQPIRRQHQNTTLTKRTTGTPGDQAVPTFAEKARVVFLWRALVGVPVSGSHHPSSTAQVRPRDPVWAASTELPLPHAPAQPTGLGGGHLGPVPIHLHCADRSTCRPAITTQTRVALQHAARRHARGDPLTSQNPMRP